MFLCQNSNFSSGLFYLPEQESPQPRHAHQKVGEHRDDDRLGARRYDGQPEHHAGEFLQGVQLQAEAGQQHNVDQRQFAIYIYK